MHALDWLNERGRILRGAVQPIASVDFFYVFLGQATLNSELKSNLLKKQIKKKKIMQLRRKT